MGRLQQGRAGRRSVTDFRVSLSHQETQTRRHADHSRQTYIWDLMQDRVCYHRDYWDDAEVLYEQLPFVGALMRF